MPAQLNDRALRRLKVHPKKRVNFGCPEKGFFEISHLHISHSASYLPPKILHNFCFLFLLGITAVPREIKNNAYAKFWSIVLLSTAPRASTPAVCHYGR